MFRVWRSLTRIEEVLDAIDAASSADVPADSTVGAEAADAATDSKQAKASSDASGRTYSRRALLGLPVLGTAIAACEPLDPTTTSTTAQTVPPTVVTRPPTPEPTAPTTTAPTTTTQPAPTTTQPATTTTQPPQPPPSPASLPRLLAARATFGGNNAAEQRIAQIGAAAWIDEQLARQADPGSETLLQGARFLNQSMTDIAIWSASDASEGDDAIWMEFDHAAMLRAVYSGNQLYEVMCHFWANHFSMPNKLADFGVGPLRPGHVRDVIRPNALGKFKDLLLANALHPAMHYYLDNTNNNGSDPNRASNVNFARELLELHTLGIIEGQKVYQEIDVRNTAKVMCGWSSTTFLDRGSAWQFRFTPRLANREAVTILEGQSLTWARPARPTPTAATVEADGKALLDFLAKHPSTARYLAWKLVRHFVTDKPDITSSNNLVDRLAAVYLQNDTDIKAVLKVLFLSPEFAASSGQKFKRPYEYFISSLRATGANPHISGWQTGHENLFYRPHSMRILTAHSVQYESEGIGAGWGKALGQPLNGRPTPDGWPDVQAAWMSSSGMLMRWNFSGQLARNSVSWIGTKPQPISVGVNALGLIVADAGTVREAIIKTAEVRFQMTITAADADAVAGGAGLSPTAARSTITADKASVAIGLLLASPAFMYRG